MAEVLTPQQEMAVNNRGGRLLVSAAAGSGKTKVLVDRLMKYLLDESDPANLDEFLIITFTEAAASELRGKIASKLSEHIAANPGNRHIQRQMQRLFLTKISTVHSFCKDIIREYAYRLDIPGDFRVCDENEAFQLRTAAMELTLDEIYANLEKYPDIQAFIDTQGIGRNDADVPNLVLKLFDSSRSHLHPERWLDMCRRNADVSNAFDASQTVWGKALIEDLHDYLDLQIQAMESCAKAIETEPGLIKGYAVLLDNVNTLKSLRGCESWDGIVAQKDFSFGTLSFPAKANIPEITDPIKVVRKSCKESLVYKLSRFTGYSAEVLADQQGCFRATQGIIDVVDKFVVHYDRLKRKRHVLDFNDLEQYGLELLLGKSRSNPTAAAREVESRFREIMVDEYQDTNAVQDAMYSVLTQKRNNLFMVGDVKQSIYQFRLADPGIFLEKYDQFQSAEHAKAGKGRKVQLSCNFRSSGGVIEAVNHVFSNCMSNAVGGLVYGEDEQLNEGVSHIPLPDAEVEFHSIITQGNAYEEEAAFVADRIVTLLDGKHYVRDHNALRPIRVDDIKILLRSPGTSGYYFLDALRQRGIPCSAGGSEDILLSKEVEVLVSLLKIISNPRQDIPLLGVLASPVGGLSADDLAALRCISRNSGLYDALCASTDPKCMEFLQLLKKLRKYAAFSTLPELIQQIYHETLLEYVFQGDTVKDNLFAFYQYVVGYSSVNIKDLDQFLRHLELFNRRGLSVEKGETGCVTIMSIHKSKGLEFPVVFLSALGKGFNRREFNDSVLNHKDLYLGLSCVDMKDRVRFPSLSKYAITAQKISDGLSDELRILYVAMTRAKDRLIMTYADKYLLKTLNELAARMVYSPDTLMATDVGDVGEWILFSALKRKEAGALFNVTGRINNITVSKYPWLITLQQSMTAEVDNPELEDTDSEITEPIALEKLREVLSFRYPFEAATIAPSKLTATQRKGRAKDTEAEQDAPQKAHFARQWRKASEKRTIFQGKEYGNAMHNVLRHIAYSKCSSLESVQEEISRLERERFISPEHAALADAVALTIFFTSELGKKVMCSSNVVREYKFSILVDGDSYSKDLTGEKILLQGVVDCAVIESDGITVIDFKTDHVTDETLPLHIREYTPQIETYAEALSRIFELPVKDKILYFFRLGKAYSI